MIDTAEAHAHHHDDAHAQFNRQVRQRLAPADRHAPATGALDQHKVSAAQHHPATQPREATGLNAFALQGSGDMRCDGSLQRHRVDLAVIQRLGHRRLQTEGVFILAVFVAPRRHGLDRRRTQTGCGSRRQQATTDGCFTDTGIGTGHEPGFTHSFFSTPKTTA